jgi:hypothetical protein
MLLDTYGHFVPREMRGHADALERLHVDPEDPETIASTDPDGPRVEQLS